MTTTTAEPTPGWVVAVLGALLLPLAAGAFILSFVQLLPVMLFGGWGTSTAWLGPVVLDVTAAAGAVMHVVSHDRAVRGWGLGLLVGATLLSIAGNLAGHAIRTADHTPRVDMPDHMAGWVLPQSGQYVVTALSVAVPLAVAALVHAFGAVLTAWLSTRPEADSHPTRLPAADPTPVGSDPTADPTGHPTPVAVGTRPDPTPAPDPHPTAVLDRPDPTAESASESGADPDPTDPTRPAPDSGADLRESGESATRPDPTRDPTPHPTGAGVGYPTDPTATRPDSPDRPDSAPDSDPTESGDPTPDPTTRPDPQSGADPADDELTRLVEQARRLVESGQIRPTADAIRPALGVGSARAREIRDALKREQRHGLRAVS